MLQFVGIDGYVPFGRQCLKRADMVKMTVGENDRGWTSALSKSCPRRGAYRGCRSRNTGIDQYPSPVSRVRSSKEDDVDDCDLALGDRLCGGLCLAHSLLKIRPADTLHLTPIYIPSKAGFRASEARAQTSSQGRRSLYSS
jgi:hypothetical protein